MKRYQPHPGSCLRVACGRRRRSPAGGLGLAHLRWTRWTRHGAAGHGTFWENLCKPSCADGHIETMRANVTLRGSADVKGHPGDRQYTRLTAVFPGKRPTVCKRRHGKVVATHPKSWTFHI